MMDAVNPASSAADLAGPLENSSKTVLKPVDSSFDSVRDSSFDAVRDSAVPIVRRAAGLGVVAPGAADFETVPNDEADELDEAEPDDAELDGAELDGAEPDEADTPPYPPSGASPVASLVASLDVSSDAVIDAATGDDTDLRGEEGPLGEDSYTDFDALFARWKATGDPQLRDRLILSQRSLVTYLARRFIDRGEIFDDVMQIGLVGLINALDAFDPSRGIRFSTFAFPSISGEIRRYFRDKVGVMRVPRRMQELYALIQNRAEELSQRLSRSPTYAEIAQSLQIEVEEVIETMELGYALDPQSLDDPMAGDDSATVSDSIGGLDPDIHAYEEHAALQNAMSRLTVNERRALEMTYFDGFSQAEIATRMNVSQMHISRLLRRALSQLKLFLEEV